MEESMAFGDGGNDVSLIREVALGVAMGNACDALKEVADYITTSVDDDGILNALEHFELI
jgi:hydroxymethylpyrimidine pyrophosphatase-like HAD family hydrolase